jgi:hypothetical protein
LSVAEARQDNWRNLTVKLMVKQNQDAASVPKWMLVPTNSFLKHPIHNSAKEVKRSIAHTFEIRRNESWQ